MKIAIIDISGKVNLYDESLVDALNNLIKPESIIFLLPGKGLISLVPRRFKRSDHIIKRLVKVLEGILNYIYICLLLFFCKIDILHFQWLPFLEFNKWDIFVLKLIKKFAPQSKIVLTIHNIYPHNMSKERKIYYRERFKIVSTVVDGFIVHTNITKQDVVREFGVNPENISVCCHGVFVPKELPKQTNRKIERIRILQFGGQSYYKGTDILVDAICKLDVRCKEKMEIHIVGGISNGYLSKLKEKDKDSMIHWKPYFLNDEELYEEIGNSDLIVLPYRAISQSGVLLLSIFFKKMIICSDLPSFVETMRGNDGNQLDSYLFFKSEDSESLKKLLERYINRDINEKALMERIDMLRCLYTWENAAKATLAVYNRFL